MSYPDLWNPLICDSSSRSTCFAIAMSWQARPVKSQIDICWPEIRPERWPSRISPISGTKSGAARQPSSSPWSKHWLRESATIRSAASNNAGSSSCFPGASAPTAVTCVPELIHCFRIMAWVAAVVVTIICARVAASAKSSLMTTGLRTVGF